MNPNPASPDVNLTGSIPVHQQAGPPQAPATPADDDPELDKLMQDVGQRLKQTDKPAKRHFGLFRRKPKTTKTQIQPAAPKPRPAAIPANLSPQPHSPVVQAAAAKPPKTHSTPLAIIILTAIVAGALIAAAFHIYKAG